MAGARNTGFVVSLALLASIAGHFAVANHFYHKKKTLAALAISPAIFDIDLPHDEIDAPCRLPDELRHLVDSGIVPANQSGERPTNRILQVGNSPVSVPAPADAAPVEKEASDDSNLLTVDQSAVRSVIEQELSHATPEEREIWFDELKSLPAGVVRDLLQVRKQIRALPRLLGGIPEKLASADAAMINRSHEIAAEPASQKIRFHSPDQASALEEGISQLRHNLMNAATPGYKRLRVMLVDSYTSIPTDEIAPRDFDPDKLARRRFHGEGCRLAPLLLDLKQGVLQKTSRPLDLAIDGEGFFVVQRGNDQLLTRCGALTFDRERRLCLAVGDESLVIHPSIQIPLEISEIQIAANGTISVLKQGEIEATPVGQLALGWVSSPARLNPIGNTLYSPTIESGEIVVGSPLASGLGAMQQGVLEQSNVDFEKEQEEIEELAMILKSLPLPNFRPVTAGKLEQSPAH